MITVLLSMALASAAPAHGPRPSRSRATRSPRLIIPGSGWKRSLFGSKPRHDHLVFSDILAPPAPPQNIIRYFKAQGGGGRNRSDGVYLLTAVSTLQVTQEWMDLPGEFSSEYQDMIPNIMMWSNGIQTPYPRQWSHLDYPPKFVLGYFHKNSVESMLLARATTPEYAPHALTFVVDFVAVDPRKNLSRSLPVLEKMRNMGIAFQVPIDWGEIKDVYGGELDRLRESLGEDPSFNYWVIQNSGKHH